MTPLASPPSNAAAQVGGSTQEPGVRQIRESLPRLTDWPHVTSLVPPSAAVEARVEELLAGLSLAQKVGQMTQADIRHVSPEEVAEFHLGSVLNGGGAWPDQDMHASLADWLALADAYWSASVRSSGIPVVWGIDAVHGNSNIFGATLFPHNIGLGAARDPLLVRRIGEATAQQIRASGQDWAFAPTVAIPCDYRWGRTYEGFSEDPRIVESYGYEAVIGLQGADPAGPGSGNVIACAKHFIGDGGTDRGQDQGVTMVAEQELINVHGQGYFGALAAGVQTVMVSFNSWTNTENGVEEGKLHGSTYALTGILKQKMGFDGIVVSDWNGVGQVEGCTNSNCARAINAGLDMVMVPSDWKDFIASTIAQVESGEIPLERINDAVRRILRVKARSGLLDAPKPSERRWAGEPDALTHRDLAREAVRKSLVLLKNNGSVLPITRSSKVLVVGKSADSLQNQSGGWSLTWQGTDTDNADFPAGTTILAGLREVLGNDNVTFDQTAETVDPADYDVVVAVLGETPYAEGVGDLGHRPLDAAQLFPEDLAVLDRVSASDTPVVTVYVTGRPLWVNRELNRSDAFVVAWLPGTEGGGVADLLVDSRQGMDFCGTLSFGWPRTDQQGQPDENGEDVLFPLGYGLRLRDTATVPPLPETPTQTATDSGSATTLEIFRRHDIPPYKAFVGSGDTWDGTPVGASGLVSLPTVDVRAVDVTVQEDGRLVRWNGEGLGRFFLRSPESVDLHPHFAVDGALVFDIVVTTPPTARTTVSVQGGSHGESTVDVTELLHSLPTGVRTTVTIPLARLAGGTLDLSRIHTPFAIATDGVFIAAFADVRWVPGAGIQEVPQVVAPA